MMSVETAESDSEFDPNSCNGAAVVSEPEGGTSKIWMQPVDLM
jgi:hypothetical protein